MRACKSFLTILCCVACVFIWPPFPDVVCESLVFVSMNKSVTTAFTCKTIRQQHCAADEKQVVNQWRRNKLVSDHGGGFSKGRNEDIEECLKFIWRRVLRESRARKATKVYNYWIQAVSIRKTWKTNKKYTAFQVLEECGDTGNYFREFERRNVQLLWHS